jgi:hypothetical protein
MRTVIMTLSASAALVMATPVQAQEGTTAADVAAAETAANPPAPDPERLAVASRVVDRIWPIGTYRRIMNSTLATGESAAEAASSDTLSLDTTGNSKQARRAQHEARTGRPLRQQSEEDLAAAGFAASIADINASIVGAFDQIEPRVREALTQVYARRYSLSELNELDAFFSTPTGSRYAADSVTLMDDPEMVAVMASIMEETLAAIVPGTADAASDAAAEAADAAAAVVDALGKF